METKIRKFGNSAGILLAKSILSECKISESDEVNLSVVGGKIIIEKVTKEPRKGWEDQLLKANALKDEPLSDIIETNFDKEEWTW